MCKTSLQNLPAMKKILTLLFSSFFLIGINLNAQITYQNYGADGWAISLSENVALDLDENGVIDFYLNPSDKHIGIFPVMFESCFSANYESNSLGSRKLRQFEVGEEILLTEANMYEYTEGDSLSFYHTDFGLAEEWTDMEEVYLGFALMNGGLDCQDGWMSVSVDVENAQLIIWEMAFDAVPSSLEENSGIEAGLFTNVKNLGESFSHFNILPNPAKDYINLNYAYLGNEALSIEILSATGQKIYSATSVPHTDNVQVNTNGLAPGMYYIHFSTPSAIFTEKLSIVK